MRECRKYWLMAVSSFLSVLFRCWMTVVSPFMMFLVLRLALCQTRILTKRRRGRDSRGADGHVGGPSGPIIEYGSGLKPLLPCLAGGRRLGPPASHRRGSGGGSLTAGDDGFGVFLAAAAAGAYADVVLEVIERLRAVLDGFLDLAIGDGLADADVHGSSDVDAILSANANDCQLRICRNMKNLV